MKLDQIIQSIAITDRRGQFAADITGIASDSRDVEPGFLFVAVAGLTVDGHDFIPEAIRKGASAVMAQRWSDDWDPSSARPDVVLVPDVRRALSIAASNFYDQPSRKLHIAGVTGTNGKNDGNIPA